MRGSRGKVRRKKRVMACSSTCTRCMATFIIISSLFCVCFAEKEILFEIRLENNQSNGESDGLGATGWAKGFLCGPYSNSKIPFNYVNTKDANRVFVEIDYEISRSFGVSGGLFIYSNLVTSENNSETRNEDALMKRRVDNKKGNRTTVTLEYDINEDDNFLNLTLYGVKLCVQVYKITVYFYFCPKNKRLSVIRTVAPSTGYTEVSKDCPIKQSGEKGTVLVAKCGSNGEWTKLKDRIGCTNDCNAGTELINGTCTVCKDNFYKATRGTHRCTECPENTLSEQNRQRCKCRTRYYRNTENGPCKTVPSVPTKLHYTRHSFNVIRLNWSMLQYGGHSNSGLKFNVKCKQYNIDAWGHCRNISLGVRGVNVTIPPVDIKNLLNNTNYTFIVYALNEVSSHVSEANWEKATIPVHLPGSTQYPRTTHTTQNGPTSVATSPTTEGTSEPTTTPSLNTLISNRSETKGTVYAQGSDKSSAQLLPYIGVAIGAIILILILIAIVIYRRKRVKKKDILGQGIPLINQPAYIDPIKYGDPEKAVRKFAKEIDRREVRLEGLIGEGEFAKVHKAVLCRSNEPPVPVALKVLKPGSTAKNREDFLTEAAVMGQFKDMNIVALEGVVTMSHPVMIITEFMHNGALSNFLVQRKNRFSEIELLGMARGIASGMKYLAKMRFVHRDLAARNVLVNENMVCKVADFGLTRELEESCQGEYVTQGGKIPIRWTAPEAYKHRRFTTASDVWSYGIVLWEIMSYAERPYGDWDNYMVMDQVTANYRLTAPTNCPKIVHQLMMECWNSDRTQRPSFSDIVEMLERWIRNPYLLKDYQYVTEKDLMADRKSCVAKSIREYLEAIKMDRYIDNFIDFGYTELYQIQNMTDDDLVNIGVPLVGHRNKIIKSLRGSERELLLPAMPVDV